MTTKTKEILGLLALIGALALFVGGYICVDLLRQGDYYQAVPGMAREYCKAMGWDDCSVSYSNAVCDVRHGTEITKVYCFGEGCTR